MKSQKDQMIDWAFDKAPKEFLRKKKFNKRIVGNWSPKIFIIFFVLSPMIAILFFMSVAISSAGSFLGVILFAITLLSFFLVFFMIQQSVRDIM